MTCLRVVYERDLQLNSIWLGASKEVQQQVESVNEKKDRGKEVKEQEGNLEHISMEEMFKYIDEEIWEKEEKW